MKVKNYRTLSATLGLAALLGTGVFAQGFYSSPPEREPATDRPAALKDVGLDQKLNEMLPLDAAFTDENGNQVSLGQYFNSGRPAVLADLVTGRSPEISTEGLVKRVTAAHGSHRSVDGAIIAYRRACP